MCKSSIKDWNLYREKVTQYHWNPQNTYFKIEVTSLQSLHFAKEIEENWVDFWLSRYFILLIHRPYLPFGKPSIH